MGRGRVLVVDDEADLRKSIRLTLTKAGYDVVEAEDGGKAIEAVRSGDNPLMLDTIIMDLVMPRVNGVEAIAYLRSQFRGVPILVLTGHPNIDNMNELYKQGIVDYLVKPIVPDKLMAAVEKAVKQWQLKSLQG
ncbi:MAG TPA: response regulator [Nitrospira sp.]|jgi:two-component system chemotaxis response regulator CheY|nr:response regulator [Nitrospira sp.]